MSRFAKVEMGPPVEVFHLTKIFNEDKHPKKVSLGVGAYRNDEGRPWVLPVVREAENRIANDSLLKEYLPMMGLDSFCELSLKLLLGNTCDAYVNQTAFAIQTLSGTGALRLGAEFLRRHLNCTTVYISNPSWENHELIFKYAGFNIRYYRYWSPEKRGLDFEGLLEDLEDAPENAVIILHVCAHNPTGCDPTEEQWKKIADVIERRNLFPFFDSAYQGFASGDLDKDAWSLRYFISRRFELFCAQSYSKNFGLYNERIGTLMVSLNNTDNTPAVKSQLCRIVRGSYSNPPSHGARIVNYVFQDAELFGEWKENIKEMASRIIEMRKLLRATLERLGTPGNWEHITSQIGMFSYTGLKPEQVAYITEKYHIFMLKSGRISMSGVNAGNVEYVAQAIYDAVTTEKHKL